METTFKRFVITGMVMTGMVLGNAAMALTNARITPLTETRQHKAIQTHIRAIENHEVRVDVLKDQVKACRKADDDAGLSAAKLDLQRSKADLKREKAYLKADKRALLDMREQQIDEQRDAKKEAKHALMAAKCELKKDLRKGNTAELEGDARLVKELTAKKEALAATEMNLRQERNDYVLMINEEIRDAKGESLATTTSENTLARLNNALS